MGVLTDLVIAERSDAADVANTSVPIQRWHGIDAKGVDHVKLATLLSIVTETPYETSLIDEFELLAEKHSDGPWVYVVPNRLVKCLAALTPAEITDHSTRWAATEEFQLDNWDHAVAESLLRDLSGICSTAIREGKDVLMWVCL